MKKILLILLLLLLSTGSIVSNASTNGTNNGVITLKISSENQKQINDASIRLLDQMYGIDNFKKIKIGKPIVIFETDGNSLTISNDFIAPVYSGNSQIGVLSFGYNENGELISTYSESLDNKIENKKSLLIRTDGALIQYSNDEQKILYDTKERKIKLTVNLGEVDQLFTSIDDAIFASDPLEINDYIYQSSSFTTLSISESQILSVPYKSNATVSDEYGSRGICWAASIASIVDYKTYYSRTALQIYQENRNLGLTGVGDKTNKLAAFSRYGLSASETSPKTYSSVKSYITSNKPIMMDFFSSTSGHSVVLKGFTKDDVGYVTYSIMDPNYSGTTILDVSSSAQSSGSALYFPLYGMYWKYSYVY